MGHVLGFEHGMDSVMGSMLDVGVRKLESSDSAQVLTPFGKDTGSGRIDWEQTFHGIAFRSGQQSGAGFPEFHLIDNKDARHGAQKKKRLFSDSEDELLDTVPSEMDWYVEV
jgi:hypothetical protein